MRTVWRFAVVYTPITALGSLAPMVNGAPSGVSELMGICRAMECTFESANELIPGLLLPGIS